MRLALLDIFADRCNVWWTVVSWTLAAASSFYPFQFDVWIEGYSRKSASHGYAVRKGRGIALALGDSCGYFFFFFWYYTKTWQSGAFFKASLHGTLKPYQWALYTLWLENPSVSLVVWMDHFHMHDFVTSFGKHALCRSSRHWPLPFYNIKKITFNNTTDFLWKVWEAVKVTVVGQSFPAFISTQCFEF